MYLPKFETLPNTGRSNKICATFIAQDISQIDTMYGKDARKNILGSMSNMFFGNCNELDTLKYVSDFFGKEERIVENTSMGKNKSAGSNSSNTNVSFNVQEKSILRIQDIASLSTGEYVGKIVDRKPNAYYRAQFVRLEDQGIVTDEYEVPPFAHGVDAKRNYDKIVSEVMSLMDVFNLNN
jgi:type IV secretory pathway TraG/TraD family ATPase VirD4